MEDFELTSAEKMAEMVRKYGILPMFPNNIKGFSVEEHTPRSYWFAEDRDGPWEWKGPVIRTSGAMYGKFFKNKAAYIMPELFLDFANYRRDGYDFDSRYDDGLARTKDKEVYDLLSENGSLLSGELRRLGGFGKGKKGGFDGIITRLQMGGYIVVTNFEYQLDKNGKQYGWGVARYSTPEYCMGESFTENVYRRTPEESKLVLLNHLKKLFPGVDEGAILNILG